MTQHKKSSLRARRGFTLIELMVSLTGAMILTVAVFMFTRDMTRFFQRQMKLSEATMGIVSGFERLRMDIARAGFLSSPNAARDAYRCPKPTSGGAPQPPQQIGSQLDSFPMIQEMGLLQLLPGEVTGGAAGTKYIYANNGGRLDPDSIMFWGNYTTPEQFPVDECRLAANEIALNRGSPAMSRIGVPPVAVDTTEDEAILEEIFPAGRMIRVTDETGRDQYSILDDPPLNATATEIVLYLLPTAQLIEKGTLAGKLCGLRGDCTQARVNPVDVIRYEISDLTANGNFARFFDADLARPTYDADRMELTRVSLLPDGSDAPGTLELITEYAVDLKFGFTVNSNVITGANTYLGEDHGSLLDYGGMTTGAEAGQVGAFGPHLIRGVHARLSVRTREATERSYLLTGAALAAANSEDLYRVEVAAGQFAKLRSLRAHISTRNTRTETWN